MDQNTLVMIKPDCVRKKMVGSILSAIESLGLNITYLQQKVLTISEAENLYIEHKGKWHFPRNIKHVTSGPSVIIRVTGEDTVDRCRSMVENYRHAHKDSIKLPCNLVHATFSPDRSDHELSAVGIIKTEPTLEYATSA